MTELEKGFALLTSHLGNPQRPVLTTHQFRTLADRMGQAQMPMEDRELTVSDLVSLGYGKAFAKKLFQKLKLHELLCWKS